MRTPDATAETDTEVEPARTRRVGLVGLGEVGTIYGTALSRQGHAVRGFDAFTTPTDPNGFDVTSSLQEAVGDAEVVLVLTAAAASHTVANGAAAHVAPGATYADLTSSSPTSKRALTGLFAARPDIALTDVAILGPVVQMGAQTPLMAAGPGSAEVADLMGALGAPVTVIDGGLGDAMAHKLLRSVFMKGLAAAVTEAVTAGRAVGFEDWITEQIARELSGDGARTIERFLRGSKLHATRRAQEMQSAADYLAEAGVDHTMATATVTHLEMLAGMHADT